MAGSTLNGPSGWSYMPQPRHVLQSWQRWCGMAGVRSRMVCARAASGDGVIQRDRTTAGLGPGEG